MTPGHLRKVQLFSRIVRACVRPFLRIEVRGMENIPANSGAALFNNHRSLIDGLLLWVIFDRPMVFMATRGVFRIPVLGRILRWMGFVVVMRGANRTATSGHETLNQAKNGIASGLLLGMYSEGGISTPQKPLKQKRGAAWLVNNGCVGIPVVTHGAARVLPMHGWTRWFPRLWRKVVIEIMPPLEPGEDEAILKSLADLFAGT